MDKNTTVMYGNINIFNRSESENNITSESSPASPMDKGKLTSLTPKRKAESTKSSTPEKKETLINLKETIQLTLSDLDLYNSSAAYYFNRQNLKERNQKIEKSKRLANSHLQRALCLVDGLEKDRQRKRLLRTQAGCSVQDVGSSENVPGSVALTQVLDSV